MGPWLTVSQAAAYLGVTRDTIYRWNKAGKLEFRTFESGQRRISQEELDGLLLNEIQSKRASDASETGGGGEADAG